MNLWQSGRDNWEWFVSAVSGLAAAYAAIRRRAGGRGSGGPSWLARRLAVERSLMRCQQERTDDQQSFDRQLAGRDEEIAYLLAKLARLQDQGRRAVEQGSLVSAPPSAPPVAAPIASPATSATSPTTSPRSRPKAKRPTSR